MRDPGKDHGSMSARRESMLQSAYELFTEKGINTVTMQDIAERAGCGKKTIHRYYDNKQRLVIEVATWRWKQFQEENIKRRPNDSFENMSGEEVFHFFLDSFLLLYHDHKDLLRFNQMFNIYIKAEKVDREAIAPYRGMVVAFEKQFHKIYTIAQRDGTIRTDIPEEDIFSTCLHLMLAAITRYAVGLVYIPREDFDEEAELKTLKEMLLTQFKAR